MRLTIIVSERRVGIEGEFRDVDTSALAAIGIAAVQWNATYGHIEYTDLSNEVINTIDAFTYLVDAWNSLTPVPAVVIQLTPEAALSPYRANLEPLSAWQIRKVLTAVGLRTQVEAAIVLTDAGTQDAWQYASSYRRDDTLLTSMAVTLGITEAQLDSMFTLGATL